MSWKTYINVTKTKKPSKSLLKVITRSPNKEALDLGAGALSDTRYLIEHGFRVDIVDSEPEVESVSQDLPPESYGLYICNFENFTFPLNRYGIVNAQYSLPFANKTHFPTLIENIKNSLVSQGFFTGTFFGPHDDWAIDGSCVLTTRSDIRELFLGWDLEIEESEVDRPTALGKEKHWHVFNVIARKPL